MCSHSSLALKTFIRTTEKSSYQFNTTLLAIDMKKRNKISVSTTQIFFVIIHVSQEEYCQLSVLCWHFIIMLSIVVESRKTSIWNKSFTATSSLLIKCVYSTNIWKYLTSFSVTRSGDSVSTTYHCCFSISSFIAFLMQILIPMCMWVQSDIIRLSIVPSSTLHTSTNPVHVPPKQTSFTHFSTFILVFTCLVTFKIEILSEYSRIAS